MLPYPSPMKFTALLILTLFLSACQINPRYSEWKDYLNSEGIPYGTIYGPGGTKRFSSFIIPSSSTKPNQKGE